MRSAQSRKIATATVALFRQFNTISAFQPLSAGSAPRRSQLPEEQNLFSSLKDRSTDSTFTHRRYLSTSGQIEDNNTHQKSSSFAVPAMGTDSDKDGSAATEKYTGYEKWVRRLYATNMFHPVKLGLENMHLLHKLLGNPMDDVSSKK